MFETSYEDSNYYLILNVPFIVSFSGLSILIAPSVFSDVYLSAILCRVQDSHTCIKMSPLGQAKKLSYKKDALLN